MKEVFLLTNFFLSFCGIVLASNRIYYVSPVDEGGTCDVESDVLEPCLPLTNYTEDILTSNVSHPISITLLFLPGQHLITSQYSVSLWGVDTFMMLPYSERGNATVTIVCSDNGTITMIFGVKLYKMWSINVLSCSTSMLLYLEVSFLSQYYIELFNCSFRKNVAGFPPALLRVIQRGVFRGNLVLNLSASNFTGNRQIDSSLVEVQFLDKSSSRNVTVKKLLFRNNSVASIFNITNVTSLEITGCTFINNNMSQVEVSFKGQDLLSDFVRIRIFHSQSYGVSIVCLYCDNLRVDDSTFIGLNINYSVGIKASQFLNVLIGNCIFQKQSVILNNDEQESTVLLKNSVFSFNYDTMYVVEISNFSIENSSFISNRADPDGGALYLFNCENVIMGDVNFTNNSAIGSGGAIYAQNSVLGTPQDRDIVININSNTAGGCGGGIALLGAKLEFSYRANIYFSNNSVSAHDGEGGAIYVAYFSWVEGMNNLLFMNSSFTSNKAGYGGALAVFNCENVVMNYINFTNNMASENGGAIYAEDSVLRTPHNRETFININSNTAGRSGGGIVLAEGAKLELSFIANFYFSNNSVSAKDGKGGAIFVTSDVDCTTNDTCPIYESNKGGKSLHFYGNHADKGSIFYKAQLDSICVTEMFKAEDFPDPSHAIASDTVTLCFCKNNVSNCMLRETDLPHRYPGQSFVVSMVNLHVLNIPIVSKIKSRYNDPEVNFKRKEIVQSLPAKCHEIKFHVYSKTKIKSAVKLYIEPFNAQCLKSNSMLIINFNIEPCPRGFILSDDICVCDYRLGFIDGCDIEGQTNNSKYNGWFEYDENYLKFNKHFCPLGYCTKNYSFLHTQCANNHAGVLCGACVDNYSIGLGSWRCLQCTHSSQYNFIWLVPLIATTGVVLVVFLLLLKLTVSSGTIYGLIFYANVISVSRLTNLPDCSINPLLSVFISWLNLDFGIEICFYPGMDTYQKTWLQFAFPLYIWFLVFIIIIVSHYSSRAMKLMGKRSIDILATLFLLSYAKLLKTIITVLSFVNITIAKADNVSDPLVTHKVWTFDGNIDYLKGKHLPLFVVALFFLIFLFLPYTLLLTFGQFLRSLPRKRGLKWVRSTAFISIMDAYHAPYNRRHRYWTGLTLLTRCVLFTVFAANTKNILNTNMFTTVIITSLLLVIRLLAANTVYQNYFIDKLDLSFLLNLQFLAATVYYLKDANEAASCKVTTVSIIFAFITFLGILFYHLYLQVRGTRLSKEILSKLMHKHVTENVVVADSIKEDSHTTTFIQLRESLLEST